MHAVRVLWCRGERQLRGVHRGCGAQRAAARRLTVPGDCGCAGRGCRCGACHGGTDLREALNTTEKKANIFLIMLLHLCVKWLVLNRPSQ